MTLSFQVDSRLLDRLNAACGILMAASAIVLLTMFLQPTLNPDSQGGELRIELRGGGTSLTESRAAGGTDVAVAQHDTKTVDAAPPES